MKHHQYFQLLALVFSAASATPEMTRDDVALPTFKQVDCPIDQSSFTFCVNVDYNDVNGSVDLILAKGLEDTPTVLKGHLDSNERKVVIVLKDDFNDEDTIVFKTDMAGGCTRFSVDISGSGETTCLNEEHRPNDDNDVPGGREPNLSDRSFEEIELSPRALDPNGYKLNVAVYYDDMFNEQFGSAAPTRIAAIMAIVDEMYSEKDTLKTEIAVNLVGVEHASGSNWGTVNSWYQKLSPWTSRSPVAGGDLSQIATDSPHEANLYVFLTGSDSKSGLGLATLDSVCNSDRTRRVNINQYAAGSSKGGDAYTAETVAHEMGHNLGIDHDCIDYNCAYWHSSYVGPRTLNGVECYGYMDYKDDTNYWSACSVADLTLYINRQANGFCLEPLVDGTTAAPTDAPTAAPTDATTAAPTDAPTAAPTDAPTTPSGGDCVDRAPLRKCQRSEAKGHCESKLKWAYKRCKSTCGLCGCDDTPGWKDQDGDGCNWWRDYCTDGAVDPNAWPGFDMTVDLEHYDFPNENCCGCGKAGNEMAAFGK